MTNTALNNVKSIDNELRQIRLSTVPKNNLKSNQPNDTNEVTVNLDSNLHFKNHLGVLCPSIIPKDAVDSFSELLRNQVRNFASTNGLSLHELETVMSANNREVKFSIKLSALNFYGMDAAATCYLSHGHKYGLQPEWLGIKFTPQIGQTMIITGLDIDEDTGVVRVRIFNGKAALFVREKSFPRIIESFNKQFI